MNKQALITMILAAVFMILAGSVAVASDDSDGATSTETSTIIASGNFSDKFFDGSLLEWTIDTQFDFSVFGIGGTPIYTSEPLILNPSYSFLNGPWIVESDDPSYLYLTYYDSSTWWVMSSKVISETEYTWQLYAPHSTSGVPVYETATLTGAPSLNNLPSGIAGAFHDPDGSEIAVIESWERSYNVELFDLRPLSTHNWSAQVWINDAVFYLPVFSLSFDTPISIDLSLRDEVPNGKKINLSTSTINTTGGTFYTTDGNTELFGSDRAGKSFTAIEGVFVQTQIGPDPAADPEQEEDGLNVLWLFFGGWVLVCIIAIANSRKTPKYGVPTAAISGFMAFVSAIGLFA